MQEIYKLFIDSIDDLSVANLERFQSNVEAKWKKDTISTGNKNFDIARCCPKCDSTNYKKHGTKNGRQRFYCKDCGRTFSESNGTIFYHSNLSVEQWKELLRGMVERLSTREIARNVGISQSATWYNVHKVFEVLLTVYGNQEYFIDIAESDETLDGNRQTAKYLNLWFTFFLWLEKHKDFDTNEKRELLYELITDNQYSTNHVKHTERNQLNN